MFKKSPPTSVPSLFGSILQVTGEKKAALLSDKHKWWNVFRREVTERIDENLFSVLYHKDNGRPNAPIRQLVAMLVLKELLCLSDEQLYERANFDMTVMLALGLVNVNDTLPSPRSYYYFRRRLHEYEQQHGRDLMAEQFARLTSDQIKRYKVDGTEVRMDSKLFGSNIRRHTLYTLAVEVLQVYFRSLSEQDRCSIKSSTRRYLEKLCDKTPDQHAYHKSSGQIRSSLATLGRISAYLLRHFKESRAGRYDLLERFFHEHFEEKPREEEAAPPPAEPPDNEQAPAEAPELKDIHVQRKQNESGSVLQSVHDEQATYRYKISGSKKQEVRGYVANITETCKPGQLNLITSVQTAPARTPDCDFFQCAIQQSEQVSGQQVREVFTDGAFYSPPNKTFATKDGRDLQWQLTAMQGQGIRFAFEWIEQDKTLKVIELQSGQEYLAWRAKSKQEKYGIIINGQHRYFTRQQIDNYFLRQQIEARASQSRKRRANVESTIHHVFYPLKGNKTRYRGLSRNKLFVLLRALCVNFRRILKWLSANGLEPSNTPEKGGNDGEQTCFLSFARLCAPQWLTWAMGWTFIFTWMTASMTKTDQILFGCQRTV